jgi:hypothetical protein
MNVLYGILQQYEGVNLGLEVNELAVEVTPFWMYRQLETFEAFNVLPSRQRQRISRKCIKLINIDTSTTPTFDTALDDQLVNGINNLITNTRQQILHSINAKSDPSIPLQQCFAPPKNTMEPPIKLFPLIPSRKFMAPYIDIRIDTLRSLYNKSRDNDSPVIHVSKKLGIGRIRDDCKTFYDVFDFRRIGLQAG